MLAKTKCRTDAAAKANIALTDSHFILADGRLGVLATATADLPKPLTGKVTFRVGISGSPVSDKGSISLLPTLDEFEIVKIETDKFDPSTYRDRYQGNYSPLISEE